MAIEMNRLARYFRGAIKPVMLLDGATGTELMKMGLLPGECSEFWNVNYPDTMRNIARIYFDSGSDAVLTNTFGANKFRLKKNGLEVSVYDLNKAGAQNARSVCPKGKFVIGNIGPLGEFLQPYGNLSEKNATCAYAEQVKGLIDGGVDGFSLETFADLNEMKRAIRAIKDNTELPYLCSMTFNEKPRGYFTENGVTIQKAVETLDREGAFAVGTNCGNGILNMIEIARQIRICSCDVRIIIQPNAGKPKSVSGIPVYDETPEFFAKHLPMLLSYDPSIIGGCCGTTPQHIKVMREVLDRNLR